MEQETKLLFGIVKMTPEKRNIFYTLLLIIAPCIISFWLGKIHLADDKEYKIQARLNDSILRCENASLRVELKERYLYEIKGNEQENKVTDSLKFENIKLLMQRKDE